MGLNRESRNYLVDWRKNAQERTSNQATILHLTDERERSSQIVTEAKEQLTKLDVQIAEASGAARAGEGTAHRLARGSK